ncbi:transporter substrate-binding domain-containing protein [Desulfovibrio mangrovi]|uniref:transporter substrate-binding domain-containing protein n=1 Tax=Desulfovibrio mangrovi TaxID=2976983 RepID=UPI0022478942|nr:transporter substrate-binding domain-containing protein [Desulfovibrio mangrovi]UZP68167.1 transporter substrate-binding domain-containing protein [Desulfovibrio mangrovi]
MPQNSKRRGNLFFQIILGVVFLLFCADSSPSAAVTLQEIRERGVLRHIGFPYSQFVTENRNGLDVDLIRLFAKHLGVRYEFVESTPDTIFADLTGKQYRQNGAELLFTDPASILGDIAANGLTVTPLRSSILHFSNPTFPTQVWLLAKAESPLSPIAPTATIDEDIRQVLKQIGGKAILGIKNTSIDPHMYGIQHTGARIRYSSSVFSLHITTLMNEDVDAILVDVPNALAALNTWPGKLKVIGPVSKEQHMAAAFAPESVELLEEFNIFLQNCMADGSYDVLINKYYPDAARYFDTYFDNLKYATKY